MKTREVTFSNDDGQELSGKLEFPVGKKPQVFAVFAHCFTCNKNLGAVRNISKALTSSGVAVLRFDFTGLGESEGNFSETSFSSNVADLEKASEFLDKNYKAPSLLVGHSLGGAAVLLAASKIPSVEAIATIGAPFEPSHVKAHFEDQLEKIEKEGEARVNIGGRPFTIRKQFLEDLDSRNMAEHIHSLRKPLLVLHSPQDLIVGIDNASSIYQNAMHPKSYISLDGADHLLSKKEDSMYVGNMIANWASRYLISAENEKEGLSTDKSVAVRTTNENYTTEIVSGKHHFLADEPVSAGGDDLGPDPYRLLMSSLGACTAMTLQMYAKRKEMDLKEVRVHLEHDKIHSEDCRSCETSKGKLDRFSRHIELDGDLDGGQREKLIEIANKCPVHRTLHSEIIVNTEEYASGE